VTEDLAGLVGAHPLFAGLPSNVAELVSGCARNAAFHAGDTLLREGEEADTFYLLRRGRVALQLPAPKGGLVIETLEAGAAVGWSWLFPPYRWTLDAIAVEPVGAIAVDAACLRTKADADPAFGYALIKRLAGVAIDRLQATRLRLLDVYGDGTTC
jgi:CRP/FNR family transcriptional regulator, cyclic AMP receptor protein